MASPDAEVTVEKEDTSMTEDKTVTEETNITEDTNVSEDKSLSENTEEDNKANDVDKEADAETTMETENDDDEDVRVNSCQLRFHPLDCKELLSSAFMAKIQKLEGYWHCRLMKRIHSDDFDIDFSFTSLSERNEIMDFLATIPSDDASKEEGFEHLWTTPDVYGETRATEDNTLIVHNVPKATTEEELKEIYPNAHVKARTRMAARDKDPDQAGYAILIFNSKEEAEETLKKKVTIRDTVLSYARVNELAKSRPVGPKRNKNQEKRGQQGNRGARGNMGGNRGRGGSPMGSRGGGQMNRGGSQMNRGGRQMNRGGGQINRGGRDGGMMGRGRGSQMGNRNESQMDSMMAVQRQLQMQLMQMKGQMQEEMMAQMDLQRNMMQGGVRQGGNKRRYDQRF